MPNIEMMIRKAFQFIFILSLLSCTDNSGLGYMDTGSLLGFDTRVLPCPNNSCPCAGGLFIEIRGIEYRFLQMPKNSNIVLNGSTKFPFQVKLNWEKTKSCPLVLIDISQMALL
jgi:hypothetical protein